MEFLLSSTTSWPCQLNCVVLALRGTSGAKDVLVDLVCEAGWTIEIDGKMVDLSWFNMGLTVKKKSNMTGNFMVD